MKESTFHNATQSWYSLKAIIVLPLALLLLLSACSPDTPPPTRHDYSLFKWSAPIIVTHGEYLARYPDSGPGGEVGNKCPNPGDNCIIPVRLQSTYNARAAAFNSFTKYYNDNNVAGFFENYPYWEALFPEGIDAQSKQMIVNGQYKTAITKDSTILFYDGTVVDNTILSSSVKIAVINSLDGIQR